MRILLNCPTPFMLAHGGQQIQIEQTRSALKRIGVAAEPLRWWDPAQTGDVLHHFGRVPITHVELAKKRGMRVVMSLFMSGVGARPRPLLFLQRLTIRMGQRFAPAIIRDTYSWRAYGLVDACIAMTPLEADLVIRIHGAPRKRVHVVPNGVEDVFLDTQPGARGRWLVCTASIIELKQVLKVAQAAVRAKTPIWFIGRPFGEGDAYARQFIEFAASHPGAVRYEGAIDDRHRLAKVYSEARGFILLSKWESLSLSALEAAACGCPLLLSDQPWARITFTDKAVYCSPHASLEKTALALRHFYDAAPALPAPPKPLSWVDVASRLRSVYESVLRSP
jgi:glycosyltransferase involved in cell wall biosynthesis